MLRVPLTQRRKDTARRSRNQRHENLTQRRKGAKVKPRRIFQRLNDSPGWHCKGKPLNLCNLRIFRLFRLKGYTETPSHGVRIVIGAGDVPVIKDIGGKTVAPDHRDAGPD